MRKLICALSAFMLYPAATLLAEHHSLIVLSPGDHTVYDIDPATGQPINQIKVDGAPSDAVFSWDELTVFVSVPDAGYVSVIDDKTFKERSRLSVPQMKRAVAGPGAFVGGMTNSLLHSDKLYVAVDGGYRIYDEHLLVYNPEWKQPEKMIKVAGRDPQHAHLQGTTGKIYYPFRGDNQVVVIDSRTDTVLKTIPVSGGPTDVAFNIGSEAWVTSADGTISIIDTNTDTVAKTIATGGKGAGRIANAPDIRYIAASHPDSGDVTIFHPLTKAIIGTVKSGKGSLDVAFAPAAKGVQQFRMKDPTTDLYVTGESEVALVDVPSLNVTSRHKLGGAIARELIHYKYSPEFSPPREGTAELVKETDLYYLFRNAMFLYDVSPIHEHRQDMAAVFTGTGTAKLGCWDPACPPEDVEIGPGGLPYRNLEGAAGTYTGISRGTVHIEEGNTPSPRRMVQFVLKNNYYRQTNPPRKESVFANNPNFRKVQETPRIWMWEVILVPGKPVKFPAGDYAFVYLAGGILRTVTEDGTPAIFNRYFNDWETDTRPRTIEALSNRFRFAIMEFK